jgi:hypothetical protein
MQPTQTREGDASRVGNTGEASRGVENKFYEGNPVFPKPTTPGSRERKKKPKNL